MLQNKHLVYILYIDMFLKQKKSVLFGNINRDSIRRVPVSCSGQPQEWGQCRSVLREWQQQAWQHEVEHRLAPI